MAPPTAGTPSSQHVTHEQQQQKQPPHPPEPTYTVADLLLESFAQVGITHIFAVLGSDHASLIEAYTRRQQQQQQQQQQTTPNPKLLIFLHEFPALSAADAFFRLTGRPQLVLAHADVGTAALGPGLHNAASGRAGVVVLAGKAPCTAEGSFYASNNTAHTVGVGGVGDVGSVGAPLRGARSEHVQWYQDISGRPGGGQAALVAPYAVWSAEITRAEEVQGTARRAMVMALSGGGGGPGPVYLVAGREALAAETGVRVWGTAAAAGGREGIGGSMTVPKGVRLGGLPAGAAEEIIDALARAQHPLLVTGYLGRSPAAVSALTDLATALPGLRVLDAEGRYMSFPATHRAYLAAGPGSHAAISAADAVVALEADVAWIPLQAAPGPHARIWHIDSDGLKSRMGVFELHANGTYQADAEEALRQLVAAARGCEYLRAHSAEFGSRWAALGEAHAAQAQRLDALAQEREDEGIAPAWLFKRLRELLPPDTVIVSDAVTNQGALCTQLSAHWSAGQVVSKGGSGLGWAVGGAVGAGIAVRESRALASVSAFPSPLAKAEKRSQEKRANDGEEEAKQQQQQQHQPLITSITGDGAFVFSAPIAALWAARQHRAPFLCIILNNGGWRATRQCVLDVHPLGVAAGAGAGGDEVLGVGVGLRGDTNVADRLDGDADARAGAGAGAKVRAADTNAGEDARGSGSGFGGIDYALLARAATGHWAYGERVSRAAELEGAVTRLMRGIREEGRAGVLDVVLV